MDMNPEMMDGAEQGEMGLCVEIYMKPDGTATVSSSQKPAPTDGQPAANLDEALEIARGLAENPEDDAEAMQAAQSGYARKAQPQMNAPSPEGLFGE
jgi:hypothetical protein